MKEQSRTWSSSQPGGQYTRSKTALLAWEVSLAVDVGYRMKDRVHVSCSRQPALTRGKELFGTIGWREDSAGPLHSAYGNRSFVRSRHTSYATLYRRRQLAHNMPSQATHTTIKPPPRTKQPQQGNKKRQP